MGWGKAWSLIGWGKAESIVGWCRAGSLLEGRNEVGTRLIGSLDGYLVGLGEAKELVRRKGPGSLV